MKKIICLILFAAMISSAFLLSSCKNTGNTDKTLYSASFLNFFDTVTVIKGYEESREEFSAVSEELYAFLERYHRMFDIYYEYSGMNNMCTVNKNAGKPVEVDSEMLDFLEFAIEMYNKSEGKVNIAMGSVLTIWHDYREEGINHPEEAKIPSREELETASAHTDISKIKIDREASAVTLLDENMRLDVGAIAKGYAAELAAKYLESKGKGGYILSLGGNIRTVGEKPDGEIWKLGIENPYYSSGEGEEYLCRISMFGNYSLVTSGNYQRYYTVDGKKYHHIIDPETLFPNEDFVLVSILTQDSGVADALSTALFNMSIEEGKELIKQFDKTDAVWYCPDGTIIYSDGMDDLLID